MPGTLHTMDDDGQWHDVTAVVPGSVVPTPQTGADGHSEPFLGEEEEDHPTPVVIIIPLCPYRAGDYGPGIEPHQSDVWPDPDHPGLMVCQSRGCGHGWYPGIDD